MVDRHRWGQGMGSARTTSSASIRSRLDHPVIDGDGHWLEPVPVFCDFLRDVGGATAVDRYLAMVRDAFRVWYEMSADERLARRQIRPPWFGEANNMLDLATAQCPALLYERLDEFGIDFAVIYTSIGLYAGSIVDPDLRRSFVRATNTMNAELFAPYQDRMTPVAVVTAETPAEAVEELTYASDVLGMKAMVVAVPIRRAIQGVPGDAAPSNGYYVDSFLDGPYDYDPLWEAAVAKEMAVTTHTGGFGWPDRLSPTNFVYNHIGHFAAGAHAAAKGIFLAGVPRRFPTLNFAFQEGGAAWAASLLLDLASHWEKRNITSMRATFRDIDEVAYRSLLEQYSPVRDPTRIDELVGSPSLWSPFVPFSGLVAQEPDEPGPMGLDDFERLAIDSKEELLRLFRERFYFGCEADDPTAALAFDDRFHLDLRAVFSSDVGHFDVTNMTEVLAEAYELVDDGLLDEADFKRFTFENAARLHGTMNPKFFAGTVVEGAVDEYLAGIAHEVPPS